MYDNDDMGTVFREMREFQRQQRASRLVQFNIHWYDKFKNSPFVYRMNKHNEYHYTISLHESKGLIQYWPSGNKWHCHGKVYTGTPKDLMGFINNRFAK